MIRLLKDLVQPLKGLLDGTAVGGPSGGVIQFFRDLVPGRAGKPAEVTVGVAANSDLRLDCSQPVQFRLSRAGGWNLRLEKEEGSAPVVVDQFLLDGFPSAEFNLPAFVADETDSPSFLLGVDPRDESRDWIWNVRRTGAEVVIDKVRKTFRRWGGSTGLQDVSARIHPNQFVGVYGPSGSGKTTLVEMILGLTRPDSGRISINGASGGDVRETIAYLPQNTELLDHLKVGELLDLALTNRNVPPGLRDEQRKLALKISRFDEDLGKKAGTLSGGQRRRLALAMALCKPDLSLLVADEPTAGLDPWVEREIMASLRRVSRTGVTVIVITHSADAMTCFDRLLVLRRRRQGQPAELGYDGSSGQLPGIPGLEAGSSAVDQVGWLMSPVSFDVFPRPLDHSPGTRLPSLPVASKRSGRRRFQIQLFGWLRMIGNFQLRDRKSFAAILACALVCVIFLHIGVGVDDQVKLGVLFSVAAPWLAATYAAMVACKALPFFSLESFAGARPLDFVTGLASSFLIPVGLIGGVFWGGLHLQIDKRLALNDLCWDDGKTNALTEKINLFSPKYFPCNPKVEIIPTEGKSGPEADGNKQVDEKGFWTNPTRRILEEENLFQTPYKQLSHDDDAALFAPEAQTLIGVLIICYAGSAIGLCSAAFWKNERVAVITCVVIFVIFMVFSRAVVDQEYFGLMGPAGQWWNWVQAQEGGSIRLDSEADLIPILFSFLSLPRYGFNLLFYHTDSGEALLVEALLASSFGAIALLFAIASLRREIACKWYFSRG